MPEADLYTTLWGDAEPLPTTALQRPAENPLSERDRRRESARDARHKRVAAGNPMVAKFGRFSLDVCCGACAHLLAGDYHGKRYAKCELFGLTHGPGTDFRVGWPACKRFVPRPADAPAAKATRKTIKVPCLHPGCGGTCVVRVWYANEETYAEHRVPTTSKYTDGTPIMLTHTVALTIASDGTILSSRHAW